MKSLKITILLLVVLTSICGYTTYLLDTTKDQVSYTQETLYGDSSKVAGMTLHATSVLTGESYSIWNVDVALDDVNEIEVEALLEFDYGYSSYQDYFSITTLSSLGRETSMQIDDLEFIDDHVTGLKEILMAVVENSGNQDFYQETVLISDFYDYYPLSADSSILDFYGNEENKELLNQAIQIPVLPEEKLIITIDGDLISYKNPTGSMSHSISTSAYQEDDTYYVAMQLIKETDSFYVDSVPAGQTVIYSIPYGKEEPKTIQSINVLKTYPESAALVTMEGNEDALFVSYKENNKSYLSILDKETGNEIQCIELLDSITEIKIIDDSILCLASIRKYLVLEKQGEEYNVSLSGTMYTPDDNLDCEYNASNYFIHNGELIVLEYYLEFSSRLESIIISCYDEEGLSYAGNYQTSQIDANINYQLSMDISFSNEY